MSLVDHVFRAVLQTQDQALVDLSSK